MMSKTFFAYQVAHKFGHFTGRNYYTDKAKARENDTIYVVSGDYGADGRVDFSLEGKFRVSRRTESVFVLPTIDGKTHPFRFRLDLEPIQVPNTSIALRKMEWYDRDDIRKNFASQQNFNPLPVGYEERFTAALSQFGDARTDDLEGDIAEIAKSDLSESEKESLIKARLGQGKFRRAVTDLWRNGQKCVLTGIAVPEILTASHIKAWRHCVTTDERLDGANGLLLAANIDRLFDRHLISFKVSDGDFQLVINKRLMPHCAMLGLVAGKKLRAGMLSPSEFTSVARYMAGHYSIFCEMVDIDAGVSPRT